MPLHPSSLNLILWKTRYKFTTIFWITKNKPVFFWLVFDFYCFSLIFSPLHSGCRFAIKKSFDLSCAMICGKGQLKMPSLYTYSPFPIRHKRDFVLFVNPQCKCSSARNFKSVFVCIVAGLPPQAGRCSLVSSREGCSAWVNLHIVKTVPSREIFHREE